MTSQQAREFSRSLTLYETRLSISDGDTTIAGTVNQIGLDTAGHECVWVGKHKIDLTKDYTVKVLGRAKKRKAA